MSYLIMKVMCFRAHKWALPQEVLHLSLVAQAFSHCNYCTLIVFLVFLSFFLVAYSVST
jgi:hypothetical protein